MLVGMLVVLLKGGDVGRPVGLLFGNSEGVLGGRLGDELVGKFVGWLVGGMTVGALVDVIVVEGCVLFDGEPPVVCTDVGMTVGTLIGVL